MKSKNENIRYKMVKLYLFHLIFICLEFVIAILLGIFSKNAIQISHVGEIMLLIVLIINILFASITLIAIAIKYKFAFKEKGYLYDFFLLIANMFFVISNSMNFIGGMLHIDLTLGSLIFSIMFNSTSLGIWLIRLLVTKKAFEEEKISLAFIIILLFVLINSILYIYQIKWLAILFLSIICLILFMILMKILFISDIKLDKLYKIGEFTIIALLEICLIAFVLYLLFWNHNTEDQSLFNSVMGVYAGVLGGLLTLAGVSWTIKNQEKNKKEDQKLLYKPNFTFKTIDDLENVEHNVYMQEIEKSVLANGKKDKKLLPNERYYHLKNFELINTDHANFVIEKFEVNNKNMLDNLVLIKKQERVIFNGNVLLINNDETIPNFKIYLKDFLENHYICNLSFDIIEEELPFKNGEIDKSGNRVEKNLKVKEKLLKNIELRELN